MHCLRADPVFLRCAFAQGKPLAAAQDIRWQGGGSIGRYKHGVRQDGRPGPAYIDEISAIGTIAVQDDDKLPGRAAAGRLKAWSGKKGSAHGLTVYSAGFSEELEGDGAGAVRRR
ncbi:hypothetical protein GCM10009077_24000 [Roseibium denhamense]